MPNDIIIRDSRKKDWVEISHETIDKLAQSSVLGARAIGIYAMLARDADANCQVKIGPFEYSLGSDIEHCLTKLEESGVLHISKDSSELWTITLLGDPQ